jgi:hypothetical protein
MEHGEALDELGLPFFRSLSLRYVSANAKNAVRNRIDMDLIETGAAVGMGKGADDVLRCPFLHRPAIGDKELGFFHAGEELRQFFAQ